MFNIYVVSSRVTPIVSPSGDSTHSLRELAEKRVRELLPISYDVYIETYVLDKDIGNGPVTTERFTEEDEIASRGNA